MRPPPVRNGLPAGCSGDDAVDNNVDGKAKPLIPIAGDHLRGVGGEKREPVARQADEGSVELVDLLAVVGVVAAAARAPDVILTRNPTPVANPGCVLVKPAGEQNPEQVLGQQQNGFGRGRIGQGYGGYARMSELCLVHVESSEVQLRTPPRRIRWFQSTLAATRSSHRWSRPSRPGT